MANINAQLALIWLNIKYQISKRSSCKDHLILKLKLFFIQSKGWVITDVTFWYINQSNIAKKKGEDNDTK